MNGTTTKALEHPGLGLFARRETMTTEERGDPEDVLRAWVPRLAASDSARDRELGEAIRWALGEIDHKRVFEAIVEPPESTAPPPPPKATPIPALDAGWVAWIDGHRPYPPVYVVSQNAYDARFAAAAFFGVGMDKVIIRARTGDDVGLHTRVWWSDGEMHSLNIVSGKSAEE